MFIRCVKVHREVRDWYQNEKWEEFEEADGVNEVVRGINESNV